jgi:hypothetical protein
MGIFDEIRANVQCPYCGCTEAMADTPQTHIALVPRWNVYGVGDALELADLDERGYLRIGQGPLDRTTILETYACKICGAWRWVRLDVRDRILVGVTAVRFDEETLASTDYVASDLLSGLTAEERTSIGDPALLRHSLIRIQDDIDAHRDEPDPGPTPGAGR